MILKILKLLGNREYYSKYYSSISKVSSNNKEVDTILSSIKEYYTLSSEEEIDWNVFYKLITSYTTYKVEERIIDKVKEEEEVSKEEVPFLVDSYIKRSIGYNILTQVDTIATEGRGDITSISREIDKYNSINNKLLTLSNHEVSHDLEELLTKHLSTGYQWRLKTLNEALGPLRKGSMLVFGARPDSGKTSFVASEVSYIAGALDKPVVWFNNEEDGARVKLRIYSTTLNKTLEEIMEDPVSASEDYIKIMGDKGKIRVIDKGYMDVRGVNNFLKDNEVGLIVFDQLRKIHGFESQTESEVLRLQMLYQWGREIAKEYAPVIAIHQARGDAEGSRYIALNQFEGSQTALQGEADAILTMGRIYEPGYENSRFLWVVKNKLDGLDPTKRNAKTELRFDGARARFYD